MVRDLSRRVVGGAPAGPAGTPDNLAGERPYEGRGGRRSATPLAHHVAWEGWVGGTQARELVLSSSAVVWYRIANTSPVAAFPTIRAAPSLVQAGFIGLDLADGDVNPNRPPAESNVRAAVVRHGADTLSWILSLGTREDAGH